MNTLVSTDRELRILKIQYEGEIFPHEVAAFRGAVAAKIGTDGILFHHHQGDKLRYSYPLIQYKRIGKNPAMICIGAGVDDVHKFFSQPDWSIQISGRTLDMKIKHLELIPEVLSMSPVPLSYRLFHWAPLSQKSYPEFKSLSGEEARKSFLERKLTGNILSFAKGVGWYVPEKIALRITKLSERKPIPIKGIPMTNFHMDFTCNVQLPEHIGLGRKVSVGMGVVDHMKGSNGQAATDS